MNQSKKRYTLAELAALTQAELVGDPSYTIDGVADLESALPSDAGYLVNHMHTSAAIRNYESAMRESSAGVIVIGTNRAIPEGKQLLRVENPSLAFQTLIELFQSELESGFTGIHPTAVIHTTASIEEGVSIGPFAVIDRECRIGQGSSIAAHVSIGALCSIGANVRIHPNVTIREGCSIGDRCIIQPGAVIGGCGFGYATDKLGHHTKLGQVGRVILEEDVEIGSNATIDRARFKATIIKRGSKIDNLVMIGHGVTVGEDNLIIAQTGIAGSTKTGKRVVLAGQVGISGHIELGDDVIVAARAGVIGSLKEPGQYYGEPARPRAEARRHWMRLLSLDKLFDRVKGLEEKLSSLISASSNHTE